MNFSFYLIVLCVAVCHKVSVVRTESDTDKDAQEENCKEFCSPYWHSMWKYLEYSKVHYERNHTNTKAEIHRLSKDIGRLKAAYRRLSEDLSNCKRKRNFPTDPSNNRNKTYHEKLKELKAFEGRCASSSGWIVIQRRFDGSVDFNRIWNEYKEGFGTIEGEFFIGLETLHLLTNTTKYELCVRIGDGGGDSAYAHYDDFQVGSEKDSYELKSLGKYSGTAGDNLKVNKNMKFSTIDRDNDNFKGHCAILNGGWWYNSCWRRYVSMTFLNLTVI